MRTGIAGVLVAAAAAASACRPAPKLSESQEYFMGRGVAAMAIERDGLSQDRALEEYVSLVGATIALESDRPETFRGYTFAVLDSEDVNAFAGASGFIFVTRGALRAMKNEDELAGVLAHEIAHVCLRHPEIAAQAAAERTGLMEFAQEFQALAGFAAGVAGILGKSDAERWLKTAQEAAPVFGKATAEVYDSISKGYSREEELAADRMAVDLLTREGVRYAPSAFKEFIARLPQKGGAWGTHPGLQGRVQAIQEEIHKRGAAGIPVDPARTQRFLKLTAGLRGQ